MGRIIITALLVVRVYANGHVGFSEIEEMQFPRRPSPKSAGSLDQPTSYFSFAGDCVIVLDGFLAPTNIASQLSMPNGRQSW